jgi:2-methylisocitrate lyase-like PEP mutase family enzyme
MTAATTRRLRRRVTEGPLLVVAGAANALAARVIEDVGFEAVYVTGAGVANTFLGAPDIGMVTLTELASHVSAIRDAVGLPLIVDADAGFGNAINVRRTVTVLERAGADAIQLEDQVEPKRCGHFDDKQVIPTAEMVQKIHAAVDGRRDDDTVIIARTDARAIEGFERSIERCLRYAEAGADLTFLEAPQTVDEVLAIPRAVLVPQVINLVEGGKTPIVALDRLTDFRIALFANLALQASIRGMQRALTSLRRTGTIPVNGDVIVPWTERQRIVDKPRYDELEERYTTLRLAGEADGGNGRRPA